MELHSWHPLAEKFPLLEGEQMDALRESIRSTGGIADNPIAYRIIDGESQGLDGRNRLRACDLEGIEPTYDLVEISEADVLAYVIRCNITRRHLTAEARADLANELRNNGHSTRSIAATLGVNQSTVSRDLKNAGDANASLDKKYTETGKKGQDQADNGKNSGAHGARSDDWPENWLPVKKYREDNPEASNKTVAKECSVSEHVVAKVKKRMLEESPPAPTKEEPKEEVLTDEVDCPVPAGLASVFTGAAEFKTIINTLNGINRQLKALQQQPAGLLIRLQQAEVDLKNLKETIRFDMPYAVCPVCKGSAKTRKANCPCKSRGWLNKGSYANLPQEFRS